MEQRLSVLLMLAHVLMLYENIVFYIRLLSKLNFAFKITNSSNEVNAQGKAFASVAVTFRHDAKAFKLPNDVFVEHAFAGDGAVLTCLHFA